MNIVTKDNRSSNGLTRIAVLLTQSEDELDIEEKVFRINHDVAICLYYYEDQDYHQILDIDNYALVMVMISSTLYTDDNYIKKMQEFLLRARNQKWWYYQSEKPD